jgi:phenylacetate-coenzyme A ligase PaaK-like adenylate-forming protein
MVLIVGGEDDMSPRIEQIPDAVEQLRLRHVADQRRARAEHIERTGWSADRLAAERGRRLRAMARIATERSPWHRARLQDVDPDLLTEADVRDLPVMTKDDVMAHFDEIVTDPRVTLRNVEAHLAALTDRPRHLLDRYQAIASGGSTGMRGVFLYGWDAWITNYLGWFRYLLRDMGSEPFSLAIVAAGKPTHSSRALLQTFSDPETIAIHSLPVTQPLEQIVTRLNELNPDVILGYPSALVQLVEAARSGDLRITPRAIATGGEPLLPETRAAAQATFGVTILNWWLSSEGGPMGIGCGQGPGLHLSDDLLIIEPVDQDGQPVSTGRRASKVLLTSLYNPALPLIRYELSDEITMLDVRCPCGSEHRLIADPQGRLDDSFNYAGTAVHPHVFRSVLGSKAGIIEYQVRQTEHGAQIAIRGHADADELENELRQALSRLDLRSLELTITTNARIERQDTGKITRFVPLPAHTARST